MALDPSSAPTGTTCYVLIEVYQNPAGLDDHCKHARDWEDFDTFLAWARSVGFSAVHGSPIVHSLWWIPHPWPGSSGPGPCGTIRVRARRSTRAIARPSRHERFASLAKTPRTWTGARSPSGLKRVRQAERRRQVLQPRRSAAKTYVAKALTAATTPTDGIDPQAALVEALSALDRAAKVGAIHPNAAARRKSRLTLKVNAALAGAAVQTGTATKTTGKAAAAKAAKARIAAGKADKAKGAQTAAGKARAALSKTARDTAAASTASAEAPAEEPKKATAKAATAKGGAAKSATKAPAKSTTKAAATKAAPKARKTAAKD